MCRYVRADPSSTRHSGAMFCTSITSADRQIWAGALKASPDVRWSADRRICAVDARGLTRCSVRP
jgi:hypothetical protein